MSNRQHHPVAALRNDHPHKDEASLHSDESVAMPLLHLLLLLLCVTSCVTRDTSDSYVTTIKPAIGDTHTAIVFVHGVFGDGIGTFRARNNAYWPDLVASDPVFKGATVVVYGYASEWTMRNLSVEQLADDMHLRMTSAEIPKNFDRIIFVCHSMGGLVTRAYLTQYREDIRSKLAFLYFFSTPSSGSDIATIGRAFLPSTQLANMSPEEGDSFLLGLQSRWINAGFGRSTTSYCAYETQPTIPIGIVVPWPSAFGLCNQHVIAIQANHFGVVKPTSIDSKPHTALRTAFQEFLDSEHDALALIPARSLTLRYLSTNKKLLIDFTSAVYARLATTDVITDAYAMLDSTSSDPLGVPFSSVDIKCIRGLTPIAVPFIFRADELTCTLEKELGDISHDIAMQEGEHTLSITFESVGNTGYSTQYCFSFTGSDVTGLENGERRTFYDARCHDKEGR